MCVYVCVPTIYLLSHRSGWWRRQYLSQLLPHEQVDRCLTDTYLHTYIGTGVQVRGYRPMRNRGSLKRGGCKVFDVRRGGNIYLSQTLQQLMNLRRPTARTIYPPPYGTDSCRLSEPPVCLLYIRLYGSSVLENPRARHCPVPAQLKRASAGLNGAGGGVSWYAGRFVSTVHNYHVCM